MDPIALRTAAAFVKSTGSASKLGRGKSCCEMLRDTPTTVAPLARNRSVTKEPRPPFAPVISTTLSLIARQPVKPIALVRETELRCAKGVQQIPPTSIGRQRH